MVFLDLLNRVDYEFSGLNFLRKIKVSIINWENNCIYNYISKKGHNCEIYDSSKTVSRHQYPYLKRIRYANISKSTVSNTGCFLISVPCFSIDKSIVLWSNRAEIWNT